jgi:hypothetical protein
MVRIAMTGSDAAVQRHQVWRVEDHVQPHEWEKSGKPAEIFAVHGKRMSKTPPGGSMHIHQLG